MKSEPKGVSGFPGVAAVLLMTLALCWNQGVGAQDTADARLQSIIQELDRIEGLRDELGKVREWQRDGLNRRIDGLGLDVLERLNEAAAELTGGNSAGPPMLYELLERAARFALEREQVLEQRAAREREAVPKFQQSAEADIARAFMEDLVALRERYLDLLVDQLEIRRSAGLDSEVLGNEVRDRVRLIIETLTGQIRLDAMSLSDLSTRLADTPLDENLQLAQTLLKAKQSRSLDDLERIVDAAERLSLPVAEQRGLLLRERRQVSVELLRRDVFAYLWREQLHSLRETVLRKGPNIAFQSFLFLILVLLAWLASRLVRLPARALLYREKVRLSTLLREILLSTCSVLTFLAGLVLAVSAIGVSLGPLLAGLGVLGIIVGLAVQDSLGNLAAGVMILMYRPYDVDDLVGVGGVEGTVKRMNLLATTVATFDNQSVVIPNRRIWGDTIINYTAHRVRRVDIQVGVAYREDPDRVIAVLEALIGELDYVLEKPAPKVHVADMADSSVTFMVKPWVKTEDFWDARWDLPRRIKKRLDAEGIEIPFPQRVVTLVKPAAGNAEAETVSP